MNLQQIKEQITNVEKNYSLDFYTKTLELVESMPNSIEKLELKLRLKAVKEVLNEVSPTENANNMLNKILETNALKLAGAFK